MLKQIVYSCLMVFLFFQPTLLQASHRVVAFPGFGLGFRPAAGAFIETPLARDFDGLFSLGGALDVEALSCDNAHYITISSSYMRPIPEMNGGSEQISVSTLYQLVDIGAGYRFRWSLFHTGMTAGVSMMVVTSTTRLYDLNEPVLTSDDPLNQEDEDTDDMYLFPNKTVNRTEKYTGVTTGPFFNLSFGFDLGRALGGVARMFEIEGAFQYARRSVRNELYSWLGFTIRPLAVLGR